MRKEGDKTIAGVNEQVKRSGVVKKEREKEREREKKKTSPCLEEIKKKGPEK